MVFTDCPSDSFYWTASVLANVSVIQYNSEFLCEMYTPLGERFRFWGYKVDKSIHSHITLKHLALLGRNPAQSHSAQQDFNSS